MNKADDQSGQLDDQKAKADAPPDHARFKTKGGHGGDDGDRIEDRRGQEEADDVGGLEAVR